jgi:hypothetical protein
MRRSFMLLACLAACAAACEAVPIETFEGELVLGTLDASAQFVAYAMADDGVYVVEVVRGFQGADMVVMAVEVPAEHRGQRVDFACGIEAGHWSSNPDDTRLQDILVANDGLLYAPYVILGWWDGQAIDASVTCEVSGETRIDLTTIDARLVQAEVPP